MTKKWEKGEKKKVEIYHSNDGKFIRTFRGKNDKKVEIY